MLPDIPNLVNAAGSGSAINTILILGWVTATVIAALVALRKSKQEPPPQPHHDDGDSRIANFPMWHFEGPLVKMFEILNDIRARVVRIEEWVDSERRRPRR